MGHYFIFTTNFGFILFWILIWLKKKISSTRNKTTFGATYDSPSDSPLFPKYLLLSLRLPIMEIPFQNSSFSEVHFPQNVMIQKHKEKVKHITVPLVHFWNLLCSPYKRTK